MLLCWHTYTQGLSHSRMRVREKRVDMPWLELKPKSTVPRWWQIRLIKTSFVIQVLWSNGELIFLTASIPYHHPSHKFISSLSSLSCSLMRMSHNNNDSYVFRLIILTSLHRILLSIRLSFSSIVDWFIKQSILSTLTGTWIHRYVFA